MELYYSLNREDYSLKNALFWGNCNKHFKKASEGRLGNRIIHLLIGIAELIPIISQIASVFEMIWAIKLGSHSTTRLHLGNNKQRQTSLTNFDAYLGFPSEESFSKFKDRISAQISKPHRVQTFYPCRRLEAVNDERINPSIELTQPPTGIEFYAKGATFYAYNADSIRDYGWGCAWRAIQTCLSSYDIKVPFSNLFHAFGPLYNLKKIYTDKYPAENLTSLKKFAPYEISSGWAEPFIGEMAMHFCGISVSLDTVNGIPRSCHAPTSVFHHNPLSFVAFRKKLEEHFKDEDPAPIMIDDGSYSLNIMGIGQSGPNTILWIADPHIKEGVNLQLSEKTANGLYKITINESGDQIDCSLNHDDIHQIPNMFSSGSYRGIHFNNKRWMVLFPLRTD